MRCVKTKAFMGPGVPLLLDQPHASQRANIVTISTHQIVKLMESLIQPMRGKTLSSLLNMRFCLGNLDTNIAQLHHSLCHFRRTLKSVNLDHPLSSCTYASQAGVNNVFVNVGSDHPSMLEAFVKGNREQPKAFPRMITCPTEVTAISIADGYARVTDQPQAVLVHVDVGTQALGQGVHNASIGRSPVLVFAGLCPFTESGELPGSRTEYSN